MLVSAGSRTTRTSGKSFSRSAKLKLSGRLYEPILNGELKAAVVELVLRSERSESSRPFLSK